MEIWNWSLIGSERVKASYLNIRAVARREPETFAFLSSARFRRDGRFGRDTADRCSLLSSWSSCFLIGYPAVQCCPHQTCRHFRYVNVLLLSSVTRETSLCRELVAYGNLENQTGIAVPENEIAIATDAVHVTTIATADAEVGHVVVAGHVAVAGHVVVAGHVAVAGREIGAGHAIGVGHAVAAGHAVEVDRVTGVGHVVGAGHATGVGHAVGRGRGMAIGHAAAGVVAAVGVVTVIITDNTTSGTGPLAGRSRRRRGKQPRRNSPGHWGKWVWPEPVPSWGQKAECSKALLFRLPMIQKCCGSVTGRVESSVVGVRADSSLLAVRNESLCLPVRLSNPC